MLANVTYGPRTSGGRAAAYRALERVGARQYTHAWPAELTRETTIRVLLARAIVRDPALILLDEPLEGALPEEAVDRSSSCCATLTRARTRDRDHH